MQRDKTIQFWDDYHDENDSQEWISTPGEELLEMICNQLDLEATTAALHDTIDREEKQRRVVSILEIGCGTSTLVRDLKHYIEGKHPSITVVACGTDVSKVCIDTNRKRDNNDDSCGGNFHGYMWYEVLNVLNGEPSRKNWDLVLDKGCIDTFLFRSRQRGSQNKAYPETLRVVLDNLHQWMGTGTTNEETGIGVTISKYIFISPRPKLKAVRDYAGFSSVVRYPLVESQRAQLEGKRNNETTTEPAPAASRPPGFMFVCTKNDAYEVGVSQAFPIMVANTNSLNNETPPSDDNQCPGCRISFLGFRKSEGLEFRGAAYWIRRWKAHCVHCKVNK